MKTYATVTRLLPYPTSARHASYRILAATAKVYREQAFLFYSYPAHHLPYPVTNKVRRVSAKVTRATIPNSHPTTHALVVSSGVEAPLLEAGKLQEAGRRDRHDFLEYGNRVITVASDWHTLPYPKLRYP